LVDAGCLGTHIAEVYSIGDEQGPGYARAAAWSPLGVSEFRRYVWSSLFSLLYSCMLGVFSGNFFIGEY